MATSAFALGTQVEYRGTVGIIRFIDDSYLTICVSVHPQDKIHDVCLVVPNFQWSEIKLLKESSK